SGEIGVARVLIGYHDVYRRDEGEPRNNGGIFHGVPSPETSEIKSFIGPKGTHNNTRTQRHYGKKCPWEPRGDPFLVTPLPQTGRGIGERHDHRGKPQE